jgi:hypothetical protein
MTGAFLLSDLTLVIRHAGLTQTFFFLIFEQKFSVLIVVDDAKGL